MKKRIKHTLNFILKEVILKYLFCYILSVIALAVPLFLNIDEPWNSWLISFSASIFSLPVIFIIYNLYVSALEKHTQDKISQKINNNVINVFAQFIYFIISRALLSSVKAKLQTNIFYFSQSNIIAFGNLNGHFHERIF